VTPWPLRLRLALVFAGGFALLLALGALGIYLHLGRSLRRDFDRGLTDAGRSAQSLWTLDRSEFGSGGATVAHVVGELTYGDRTLVAFDSAGRFLAASQRVPGEPWFNDAPAAGPLDRPETLTLQHGTARVLRVITGDRFRVVIAMSTVPLERRLQRLSRTLATVLPAILVLGTLFGAWGARLVLRPIIEVAASAERIGDAVARGATEFATLPPRTAGDELTTLTDAFNRLVTRLSAALELERAAADQQRQFLADAAHELRTPVAILRSEADVALAGPADPTAYREALERIASEAAEMGTLVSDLLLLSRGQAAQPGQQRTRCFLDDAVNHLLARVRALPAARERELRRGEFEAAPVDGDAVLLERALLALVHNALVHAPDSPVEVSTGTRTDEAGREWSWARVRDWGPGVPAEARERIFERFARLDHGAPGTGLGLSIARWVAETHAGTLTLDEVPQGASFTLSIPLA
jgi:two-component system OmpR family sensor kinase